MNKIVYALAIFIAYSSTIHSFSAPISWPAFTPHEHKIIMLTGTGIIFASVGAYSMKKSIDIFMRSTDDRQSVLQLIRRHLNAALLGGFGLSSASLGLLIAYFAPEITGLLSRQYRAP